MSGHQQERALKVLFSGNKCGPPKYQIIIMALLHSAQNTVVITLNFVAVREIINSYYISNCISVMNSQLFQDHSGRLGH